MELKPSKCVFCGGEIEYFQQDEHTILATHRCRPSDKFKEGALKSIAEEEAYLRTEGGEKDDNR